MEKLLTVLVFVVVFGAIAFFAMGGFANPTVLNAANHINALPLRDAVNHAASAVLK